MAAAKLSVLLCAGCMFGLAPSSLSAEPSPGAGAPTATTGASATDPSGGPGFIARARVLLASAYKATDSGAAWLQTHLTEQQARELWGELKDETRVRLDHAIDLARTRYERTLGIRMLDEAPSGVTSNGAPPIPTWTQLSRINGTLPSRLVLLVHGLDEPGDIWDDLAPRIQKAGLRVARFDYHNDGPIKDDADELAAWLRTLKARGVSNVDLVCYSMGGLVAREVLTRPNPMLYAGEARGREGLPDIDRLIMIATPNAGSSWAHLEILAEARDQFQRWLDSDGTDSGSFAGFLVDGHGEAADDLLPRSPFLTELNARPLPRDVRMTLIAGKMMPVTRQDALDVLQSRFVKAILSQAEIEKLAAQVEVAANGLGDGPVATDSVKLNGVEDSVVCEGEHCYLLKRSPLQTEPPATPIVLDRLTRAPR